MSYLSEEIYKIRKKSSNIAQFSTDWIQRNINKSSTGFEIVKPKDIKVGSFYFMVYDVNSAISRVTKKELSDDDLTNKTSNLENFSAILVTQKTDNETFCAINFNFYPTADRIQIMDDFIEQNLVEEKEGNYSFKKSLPSDLYKTSFDFLHKYAYEYTLRYYKYSLATQLYLNSLVNVPKLLTISTYQMTKVEENQLVKLHAKKMSTQDQRDLEVGEVLKNYESLANELKDKFKELELRMNAQ